MHLRRNRMVVLGRLPLPVSLSTIVPVRAACRSASESRSIARRLLYKAHKQRLSGGSSETPWSYVSPINMAIIGFICPVSCALFSAGPRAKCSVGLTPWLDDMTHKIAKLPVDVKNLGRCSGKGVICRHV